MRRRLLSAAAVGCLSLALAVPAASSVGVVSARAATPLCGAMAGTSPHITKVLWIAMENESYGTDSKDIPGNPSASYIKNSVASQCGSTTNYHALTHPSYPNYLAMTSGSTQGVTSDTLGFFNVPSIFSQADPSWRSYEEFMPTGCDHTFRTGTNPPSQYYVGRHNPAASYSALPVGAPTSGDCPTNDEPLGTTSTGALQHDVSSGALSRFSFVTPGLCDDMHTVPAGDTSCPDIIKGGDNWLSTWLPLLTSGPDYTSGNLLIDVVWDEGRGGSNGEACLNSSAVDCIVPNLVISPYTTSTVSSINLSHYSLLKTTEEILGLPLLGGAADPATNDMCSGFGICPSPDTPPTASFTSSCTGLSCSFDGTGSTAPGSTITGYSWDFSDGGTSTSATPNHMFASGGSYPVTLTVTNADGLTDSVTNQVDVSASPPPAIGFVAATGATKNATSETVTVPSSVAAGDTMILTASGATTSTLSAPTGWSLVGTQPNSVMTTSVWSRAATAADAGTPVTVGFPAKVQGSVQLSAYSGVDSSAPIAAFAGAGTHAAAMQATTPSVTVPDSGDWLLSTWSVKSSTVTNWTGASGQAQRNTLIGTSGGRISSLLADSGAPVASGPAGGLVATTDQSFSASTATSLVLAAGCGPGGCSSSTPPTASFTSSCTGLSCSFDGTGSTAPGSTITGYSWDFSDGGTSTSATPNHMFASGGSYPVTLTVTNADGLTDSVTNQVDVSASPPPAIGFVAATGVTKNSSSETVTVPSSVTTGDAMVLVATGVTTGALTAPTGWTQVATQPNTVTSTAVWSRVATASDLGSSVKVTFPATVKGSVQLAAYSGTSASSPVAAVATAATHTNATVATTPALAIPATGDWLLSYWAAKSSAVTAWTSPPAATARNAAIGTGGGQISSLLSDSAGPVAAGTAGGLNASTDQQFSASATVSLALAPGP